MSRKRKKKFSEWSAY